MIKIDKDIAPPAEAIYPNSSGHKSKYPFREMEIGDSFFVEMHYSALKQKCKMFEKTKAGKGKHFAVTAIDNGARCWLVGVDNEF